MEDEGAKREDSNGREDEGIKQVGGWGFIGQV